jgi:DHA1 family multidrug resistance protein-like MFS transporter
MLFAARILGGVLSSATLPTAMAYISDSTSEDERGGGMGLMGAAMGIGMVLGPGLAGILAERSLALPFFLASALSTLALALILAVLPESLDVTQFRSTEKTIRGPQFREMWDALFSPIGVLLFMAFLVSFGLTIFEAVFGLYSLERFGYGPKEVGGLLTVIGFVSAAVQGGLTGLLTRRFGEAFVIKASLFASAIGFPLLILGVNLLTIILTLIFFITANSMLRPAVSSLTSKQAEFGQGIAMGLNNAFMSLGRSTGPLLAGYLFDYNIKLPYLVGGVIMLFGFIVAFFLIENTKSSQELKSIGLVE